MVTEGKYTDIIGKKVHVIAVYHRINDVEDKWIVAEEGTDFSDEEIMKKIISLNSFLRDTCVDNVLFSAADKSEVVRL